MDGSFEDGRDQPQQQDAEDGDGPDVPDQERSEICRKTGNGAMALGMAGWNGTHGVPPVYRASLYLIFGKGIHQIRWSHDAERDWSRVA